MELDLIDIMVYGFGSAIVLLFIFVAALSLLFIRHIVEEKRVFSDRC